LGLRSAWGGNPTTTTAAAAAAAAAALVVAVARCPLSFDLVVCTHHLDDPIEDFES
jgi:hypothetical protein